MSKPSQQELRWSRWEDFEDWPDSNPVAQSLFATARNLIAKYRVEVNGERQWIDQEHRRYCVRMLKGAREIRRLEAQVAMHNAKEEEAGNGDGN